MIYLYESGHLSPVHKMKGLTCQKLKGLQGLQTFLALKHKCVQASYEEKIPFTKMMNIACQNGGISFGARATRGRTRSPFL